jgi:hypothetical protein
MSIICRALQSFVFEINFGHDARNDDKNCSNKCKNREFFLHNRERKYDRKRWVYVTKNRNRMRLKQTNRRKI